jgi:hypothetical protein
LDEPLLRQTLQTERRYRCQVCRRTFAVTTGTPFYRLHTAAGLVLVVLSLLSWGCPLQAIVVTFQLDERTVAAWLRRAGQHCRGVHQHLVQQGEVDLQHVQADELWVKLVGQRAWLAMALAAPSRLWLGGVLSPQRDQALITALVQQVRACVCSLVILVCTDGLAAYVTAVLSVFRHRLLTGRRGRPRLMVEPGLLLGQVVKRYAQRHVVSTSQRVVRGAAEAIDAVLAATGTGAGIHTAYIERLNATFRSHLAPLARRGRAPSGRPLSDVPGAANGGLTPPRRTPRPRDPPDGRGTERTTSGRPANERRAGAARGASPAPGPPPRCAVGPREPLPGGDTRTHNGRCGPRPPPGSTRGSASDRPPPPPSSFRRAVPSDPHGAFRAVVRGRAAPAGGLSAPLRQRQPRHRAPTPARALTNLSMPAWLLLEKLPGRDLRFALPGMTPA